MKALRSATGIIVACLLMHHASAKILPAPPFTDHAVLQRDVAVPVWGWDETPGATVTVAFRGQTKETRVNQSGLWRLDLDALPATAEGADLVITSSTTVTLHDVVVGEVWLASGQSNMEWGVDSARGYAEEKAKPANPLIRELHVEHIGADLPATTVPNTGWRTANADTIGRFSAAGYFFAQSVAQKLNVPVGIIHASWGGTAIESWIPEGTLVRTRAWRSLEPQWRTALKEFPQRYANQPALEAAWNKAWEENHSKGTPITMEWPRPPMGPGSGFAPSRLFNGMLAPFVPYALRGVLWYQGESNVGRHDEYRELLPALISSWRSAWPQGDFPFLIVQLPNFTDNNPTGRGWAQLREAQAYVAQHTPAAALAVIIDGDEPDNLHPTNKRPVGERLALIALHQIHDQRTLEWSGPTVQSVQIEGTAIRVLFTHATGLTVRATPNQATGFEVAGLDKVFRAASVQFAGESVLVASPEVSAPVAVRYAYTNAAISTLVNSAGLPTAPFRSDNW
jgi:sialate O-acetylesterase